MTQYQKQVMELAEQIIKNAKQVKWNLSITDTNQKSLDEIIEKAGELSILHTIWK